MQSAKNLEYLMTLDKKTKIVSASSKRLKEYASSC